MNHAKQDTHFVHVLVAVVAVFGMLVLDPIPASAVEETANPETLDTQALAEQLEAVKQSAPLVHDAYLRSLSIMKEAHATSTQPTLQMESANTGRAIDTAPVSSQQRSEEIDNAPGKSISASAEPHDPNNTETLAQRREAFLCQVGIIECAVREP